MSHPPGSSPHLTLPVVNPSARPVGARLPGERSPKMGFRHALGPGMLSKNANDGLLERPFLKASWAFSSASGCVGRGVCRV